MNNWKWLQKREEFSDEVLVSVDLVFAPYYDWLHGSFLRRRLSWNNLNLIKDTFLFIRSSLDNFCLLFLPSIGPPQPSIVFFCHENIGRRVEGEVPVCPQDRFLIFNQISVMHAKIKGRDLPALYSAWFDHSDKILIVQLSPGCWKI